MNCCYKISLSLLVIIIMILNSCKKKDKVDCSIVTYSGTISQIISGNCTNTGCHGASSSNGDFTTYAGLKTVADNGSLHTRVVSKKDMPPGGLSSENIQKINCWIENGAPNN